MSKKFLKAGIVSLSLVPLAAGATLAITALYGNEIPVIYDKKLVTLSNTKVTKGKDFVTIITPIASDTWVDGVTVWARDGKTTIDGVKFDLNVDDRGSAKLVIGADAIPSDGFQIWVSFPGSDTPEQESTIYPYYFKLADTEAEAKIAYGNKVKYTFQCYTAKEEKWTPDLNPSVVMGVIKKHKNVEEAKILTKADGKYVEPSESGLIEVNANGEFTIEFDVVGFEPNISIDGVQPAILAIDKSYVGGDVENAPWLMTFGRPESVTPEQSMKIMTTELSPAFGGEHFVVTREGYVSSVDNIDDFGAKAKDLLSKLKKDRRYKELLKFTFNESSSQGTSILKIDQNSFKIFGGRDLMITENFDNIDISDLSLIREIGDSCFTPIAEKIAGKKLVGSFRFPIAKVKYDVIYGSKLFGTTAQIPTVILNGSLLSETTPGGRINYNASLALSNVTNIKFNNGFKIYLNPIEQNNQTFGFAMGSSVKTLLLNESIENIGDYAFYNCTNLEYIDISSMSINFNPLQKWSKNHVFENIKNKGVIVIAKGWSDKIKQIWRSYLMDSSNGLLTGDNWPFLEI